MNRSTARMGIPLLLTSVLMAPSAYGIGLCEDVSTTQKLTGVSVTDGLLLIEGKSEWCEETEEGDEKRGSHAFAQILYLEGKVKATFAKKKGAEHIEGSLEVSKVTAWKALAAARKKHGFVAPKTLAKSPAGACKAAVRHVKRKDGEDDERPLDIAFAIKSGRKTLHRMVMAEASKREDVPNPHVMFLPATASRKAPQVLIWALIQRCDGGPPAGYFGDDDPGECYGDDMRFLKRLTVDKKSNAKLGACFSAGR